MTKFHIAYRNAKGQMKSADPFNCPADAPEAVQRAAAAIQQAFSYGPPAPVEGAVIVKDTAARKLARQTAAHDQPAKRGRGRPAGYVVSQETKDRISAGWARRREARASGLLMDA